jgi:hypothetical protein
MPLPTHYISVYPSSPTVAASTWYSTNATSSTGDYFWYSVTSGTAATTVTIPIYAPVYMPTQWMPAARRVIDPRRVALARRWREQAIQEDLSDLYRQEERRQRAELGRHSEAAMARSRELLLEHLTPAQRESFERNKWFVIEGGKSRQRYRIRAAAHMVANIDVLDVPTGFMLSEEAAIDSAKVRHRLCAHCRLDEVPLFDQLLAQKLMLEFDEERFLSLANHHRAAA